MFTNVGTGLPVETRIITLSVVGMVWEYLGGVDPVSADAAGPGLNFIVDDGVSQGTVESDLEAINGLVWRILDTADLSTEFRTQPNVSFAGEVGMTIVARVRVAITRAARARGYSSGNATMDWPPGIIGAEPPPGWFSKRGAGWRPHSGPTTSSTCSA